MGDLNMGPRVASGVPGLQALVVQSTFPVDQPHRQIDHILARGVRADVPGHALQQPLSDHLALVVDVAELGSDG